MHYFWDFQSQQDLEDIQVQLNSDWHKERLTEYSEFIYHTIEKMFEIF